MINYANKRIETWLDRAEKMLNFAETAKVRFELGDLNKKHEILAALGSNLVLLNQKLVVSLAKPIELMQEIAPEVQDLHNRLEPTQVLDSQQDCDTLYSQNEKWGG